MSQEEPRKGERIAKLLARAGVASRREIERMIADGRVKLNDVAIDTPATVLETLRGVTVDDQPVAAAERTRLFAFHKPPGLITAERDPAGRPTIYNALVNALPPGAGRVMPVGRLDFSTEGLLLLTNDGEFKRELELPATGVPRTYRARAFGDVTQTQLEELAEGVTVEGMHYGRIIADMERRTGRNQWIEMTLTEGKNREVRRVLEFLGLEVSRLIRTAYGPFDLGDLPRGAAVEIGKEDLERFRASLAKGGDAARKVRLTTPAIAVAAPRPVRAAAPRPAPARKHSDDKPKPRPDRPDRPEGKDRRKPYAAATPAKDPAAKPRRAKPYADKGPAKPEERPARRGRRGAEVTGESMPRRGARRPGPGAAPKGPKGRSR